MPVVAVGVVGLAVVSLGDVGSNVTLATLLFFGLGMALYVRLGTPHGDPVDLSPPTRGRWQVLHSPTTNVPSHGIHAWAQTHAVDLVYDPADSSRPEFASRPVMRPPGDFPGFGRALYAPVDGVVVRARSNMRDHRARNSPLGLAYLVLESVRELLGPPGVLGNHLVFRDRRGAYVLLAHLRRDSLKVEPGDEVSRGDVVAECGNSGNSTEPHLHLQAQDRASVWVAAGLPLLFDNSPLPENEETIEAGAAGTQAKR